MEQPTVPICEPTVSHKIRSDSLAQWRDLLGRLDMARGLTELLQFELVVDANVVLADVRWLAGKRLNPAARTTLQELIAAGTVVAFAPVGLRREVEKHIARIAAESGTPVGQLSAAWTDYERSLRFYEPDSDAAPETTVTVGDPGDLPYLELWRQLGAAAVYSRDHDLRTMGAQVVTAEDMTSLRDFTRAGSLAVSIKVGGALGLLVAGGAAVSVVRVLARAVTRLPPAARVLLLGAIAALLIHPHSRSAVLRLMRRFWLAIASCGKALGPLAARLSDAQTASGRALGRVRPQLGVPKRTALTHARAICTAADRALSLAEIAARMRAAGHVSKARHFPAYLRRLFGGDPRFVETAPGLWTVCRSPQAAPVS